MFHIIIIKFFLYTKLRNAWYSARIYWDCRIKKEYDYYKYLPILILQCFYKINFNYFSPFLRAYHENHKSSYQRSRILCYRHFYSAFSTFLFFFVYSYFLPNRKNISHFIVSFNFLVKIFSSSLEFGNGN